MSIRRWREQGLAAKLFASFVVLSIVPIGVMAVLTFGHLRTIQDASVQETQALLISSQIHRLRERLGLEAERLSALFSRIQDEAHGLRTYAEAVVAAPGAFTYRNGSRYRAGPDGSYGNPAPDGNSVLFVPRYRPGLDPIVGATEALDLVLKPLAQRESRMVLGWIILREAGITRAFPWRDFGTMPRDKDYTTWPFYYLADLEHNPSRREVFTPVYLDPLSGEWMTSCLAPVYLGDRHEATVGIDITIQNLLREIGEIRLSEGASSLLLSGTSIIAASVNLPLAALGLAPGAPPHGQDLSSSQVARVRELAGRLGDRPEGLELLEAEGLRAFVGHAAVAPPGWRLALLVPEADVVGPAQESAATVLRETVRVRRNFIHVLAFVGLGVVGLTWLVFAHQSRGLRTLVQGIQRLGRGELSHRLEGGAGEFGRLAKALNSMAEGLAEKKRELQRAYAEVEQERKLSAVGRLAAGVAHEVNNPLATISTYAQMLLRRRDLPPDAAEDLGVVMEEIRRIQDKLRNLLDLSRLQSPVKTRLDPNRLVREVADLVRHEAAARGVELAVDLDPAVGELAADRSGL
ncbi:MAG: sensor histidine kinase [Deferrisomatales bacterium]